MIVAVTGPTGFVGSALVTALLARGHSVRALRRGSCDVGARRWLEQNGAEALIHCAWAARPPDYLTAPGNGEALAYAATLFQAAAELGMEQVVAFGTCIECGPVSVPRTEDLPPDPRSPYAAAKVAACLFGTELFRSHPRTRFAWLRPFHLYGPGEDGRRLVPTVLAALKAATPIPLSAGEQVRDWIHVEDAALAAVCVMESRAIGAFHLCTEEPESLRKFLLRFGALSGRPDLLRFGERAYGDAEEMMITGRTSRLRALGWSPAPRDLRVAATWAVGADG